MKAPEYELLDGTKMPALGFGTYGLTGADGENALRHALSVGYRHIDTADSYDNHDIVGRAIQDLERSELFITTKLWYDELSHDDAITAVDRFLRELNTDYIDLLLIHWPSRSVPVEETLSGMQELARQKKVRSIGVSNFSPALLDEATRKSELPIVNDQVEFNVYHNQRDLLEFCDRRGIIVTAYRPLMRGRVSQIEELQQIAEKYNRMSTQVALNWLLAKGLAPIPKSRSPKHIEENWGALGWELDQEDVEKIDHVSSGQQMSA